MQMPPDVRPTALSERDVSCGDADPPPQSPERSHYPESRRAGGTAGRTVPDVPLAHRRVAVGTRSAGVTWTAEAPAAESKQRLTEG